MANRVIRAVRGRRMAKEWVCIPAFQQSMTGDATFVIASLPFVEPRTVLRMLGEFIITPTTAPAAQDAVRVGIGLGAVSTDAFGVGASAMPDPLGEPEYPWLYWSEHWFFFPSTSLTPPAGVSELRRSFDIRSMRKFTNRQSLVFVFQYANSTGNPPLSFFGAETRVLVAS